MITAEERDRIIGAAGARRAHDEATMGADEPQGELPALDGEIGGATLVARQDHKRSLTPKISGPRSGSAASLR
jgi:hypothetical protein